MASYTSLAQMLRAQQPGHEILDDGVWNELGRSLRLAPREIQVIQGVFDDQKELAIASDLGISQHTVHTYLERVYRKLAVGSRVSLVVRVMAEAMEHDGGDGDRDSDS
jgi:DNA-binding NarL/FixJ family response regulator